MKAEKKRITSWIRQHIPSSGMNEMQPGKMKPGNAIHVCFSTDNHYAPYCGAAILSMFQNKNPDDRICVYILHKDLSNENIKKLSCLAIADACQVKAVQIDEKQFEQMPLPPDLHFTIEAYYRFVIPRIFPELDRMLYVDCDILIRKSLWELYSMDMQNFLLAMVRDAGIKNVYYNSGVMLMDCSRWRKDNIEEALYQYAENNRERIRYPDQDVINGLLVDRILEIDKKWNRQIALHCIQNEAAAKEIVEDRNIHVLHYFGSSKPWEGFFENTLVDEYFAYTKQIPWELPDRREEHRGMAWGEYNRALRQIRSCLHQGKIKKEEKIAILYETEVHQEIAYAVKNLGLKKARGYLIKSDQWKEERWDKLIIEYHNIVIIDYILQSQGYDMEEEPDRYILIPDTSQQIGDDVLVSECIAYMQQAESTAG